MIDDIDYLIISHPTLDIKCYTNGCKSSPKFTHFYLTEWDHICGNSHDQGITYCEKCIIAHRPTIKIKEDTMETQTDNLLDTVNKSEKHAEGKTFVDYPEGYYHLYAKGEIEPCLVKCYFNPDAQCKGFGFMISDGCGFLPLWDLVPTSTVIPVTIIETLK